MLGLLPESASTRVLYAALLLGMGCRSERYCGEDIPVWIDGDAEVVRESVGHDPIQEVMGWIQEFGDYRGEPLCVAEVTISEVLTKHDHPVAGWAVGGHAIRLSASSWDRSVLFHEACHIVDHDEQLSSSAEALFPAERRDLNPTFYEPEDYAGEHFANACKDRLTGLAYAYEARPELTLWMLEHVWKGLPPVETGSPSSVLLGMEVDEYTVTIGHQQMITEVVRGDEIAFTTWDWRTGERLREHTASTELLASHPGTLADNQVMKFTPEQPNARMWTSDPDLDGWQLIQRVPGPSGYNWNNGWFAVDKTSNPPALYRLSDGAPEPVAVDWDPGTTSEGLLRWRDAWWVWSHGRRQLDSEFGERVYLPPYELSAVGDRLIHAITPQGVWEWDVEREVMWIHPLPADASMYGRIDSDEVLVGIMVDGERSHLAEVVFE